MDGNHIKVSVIVTVYKTPKAVLKKCLDSLLSQTMPDAEFILVDDGSIDNSGKICDSYSEFDNRFQVIHKENNGLSAARNTGFIASRGDWIMFVDGDDWIEPDCCQSNYLLGIENNVDVVIFGTIQEIGNSSKPFKYHYPNGTIFEKDCRGKLLNEILNFNGNIATAWAKLIKRDFLLTHEILHNEILRQGSEGVEFNLRLFNKVERVYFTDAKYYHYVYNPFSISAKHNEQNHYFVLKCLSKMKEEIEKFRYDGLYEMWCSRVASVVIAAAVSGYFSSNNDEPYKIKKKKYVAYLHEPIIQEAMTCSDLSLSKQRKFILFLIKHNHFFAVSIIAKIRYKQKHKRNKSVT